MIEFANGVKIGGEQVVVMAGPCSIENEEQIFEIAKQRESGRSAAFCAEEHTNRAARRTPFRAWGFRG